MKNITLFGLLLGCLTAAASGHARSDLWVDGTGSSNSPRISIPSLAPLVKARESAVLVVNTVSEGPEMPALPFPFGRERQAPRRRSSGQGSGFIIHPHGYALTNQHVVEGAIEISVKAGNKPQKIKAQVIGSDANTDVALLKLEGDRKDWPVIPLADSSELEIGDFVVAIGNPFGLEMSVSLGILSARGRRDVAPSGRAGLYDFLQTDASINPGNSGGPLLNLKGEAIGINAAVNTAGQGIGFAIPINLAKKVAMDLKDKGRVVRSYIGVTIDRVTPLVASNMGLKTPHGALVRQVAPNSPAARAGIEPGDIITHFNGQKVENSSQLPLLAGLAGVDKKIKLKLVRDERPLSLKVKLGEMPTDRRIGKLQQKGNEAPQASKLGMAVQDIDGEARRVLKISKKTKGALVVKVRNGSAAAFAGIRRGDVITKVNGKKIKSARSFVDAVKKVPEGKLVRLMIQRQEARLFIAVKKP